MQSQKLPKAIAMLTAITAAWLALTPVVVADEAHVLTEAIALFDRGEYLAAQELLVGIDRSQLNKAQQTRRDDYLTRVQVALTMYEKALRDLEDAETAVSEEEFDRAERLLHAVIENRYAAEELRRVARSELADLTRRTADHDETPPTPQPASTPKPGQAEPPAKSESAEKHDEHGGHETHVDDLESTGQTAPTGDHPAEHADHAGHDTDEASHEDHPGVVVPEKIDVERARVLIEEADEMVRGGRYAEAERLYHESLALVPGHPDAVAGLDRARQHAATASGRTGESLIDRIRRKDAINWQRTVAEFGDVERAIRAHVANERFEQANQLLLRARQIIEGGRQFADPISKYETLNLNYETLATFVRTQERSYNQTKVAQIRTQIEQQRSERLQRVEENRARQVESLMKEALQHRKDGDLSGAVGVLRQVVAVDPRNQPARWLMDILEDQRLYRKQAETRKNISRRTQESMIDVEESKIPWHKELQYPKNWLEIINRPDRRHPGELRQDSRLQSALDRPVPVDFHREPFGEVMDRLADAHQLNIVVNWHDLERVGVNRNVPIDLHLPREIALRKAITEILEQAGGGAVVVGYDVADGVVTIASRQFLDQKTYPAVYDINDLLMTIPEFDDPPAVDLRQATTRRQGVVRTADQPWRVGDDDDDEPDESYERSSRVQQVIDLIQETIAPDSWRDRGGSIGSIKEINGQLVVTQNSAAHRHIGDLLSKLREERSVQIAVEAIFLTVSSHYLEELGLNVNLVLNAGNAGFDFLAGGNQPLVDPVLGNRLLLPRTFTRLGFTPNTPALGTALGAGANPAQPFGQPFLVPQRTGGTGSQATPVPIISNVLDFTNPSNLPSDIPGSFGGSEVGPALSVFGSFLDNIQVDLLLRATQADSRTSVLTAPRVVVFNGFGAWIGVTLQQNFVSTLNPVLAQGAVAQAPVIGQVNAGAVLNIFQAVVTADRRYVMMTLSPGVTRLIDLQTFPFSGGTGALNAFVQLPTLSTLRVQTAVSVPDGGTLLIGGQKLSSESEVDAGVPVLSKIPILKRFYSSRTMVKDEQTLLILIKPQILIQSEQEELAFPSFANGS